MTNVVMISKDRPRLLRQAIESLYANTVPKDFNLTVVDDDSQDFRAKKYLRSLTYRNFCLLEVQNSGHVLAQLKNLGVFYSRQRFGAGDWLHLGDSDVCFMPGWLETLHTMAYCGETVGFRLFGGQVHPFHNPISGPIYSSDMKVALAEHAVLDGPSWFMRWKTWREVGPLSRTCAPGTCQSEDAEWCARLTAPINGGSYRHAERYGVGRGGGRIGVVSPHIVIHTGLTNTKGEDCVGRAEREAMIPAGVVAE